MNLVRLGKVGATTYLVDRLIEGYTSLIWTERFNTHGEFILKTYNIEETAALLPENTFVSHTETRHVMEVETHTYEEEGEGEDAVEVLTIQGRAVTHILESRWIESNYQKKRKMRKKYTPLGALSVLLFNAVDNASGKDVTRGDPNPFTDYLTKPGQPAPVIPEQNDFAWTKLDVIPNVAVTESVVAEGSARWWQLEQGVLYPQFQKILDDSNLGFRALRPKSPSPGTVITVKTNLDERGEIVRTARTDVTQLAFDIYAGVDRSAKVQFNDLQGHLAKPTTLKSSKEHRTLVEVISGTVAINDITRPGEAELTGWARRTIGYDAGAPEIPDEPEKPDELKDNATEAQKKQRRQAMDKWIDAHAKWKNKRNTIISEFEEESKEAARRVLKDARRVRMFSADISELAPYVYGKDYDLGDLVTLNGNHGFSTKMVVSEFVRTEDANGDRGLPGLIEP